MRSGSYDPIYSDSVLWIFLILSTEGHLFICWAQCNGRFGFPPREQKVAEDDYSITA